MLDVIVVGGGIAGLATAYHLGRSGRSVRLLEKATAGSEASSRNAGGVRQQSRDPRETELAVYSARLWSTLAEELRHDVAYRRGGGYRLALSDRDASELRPVFERDLAAGLPVTWLDGTELAQSLPTRSESVVAATFCASDGQADPVATCAAFAAAARAAGVDVREGVPADAIEVRSDGSFLAAAGDERHESRALVVAAGPWSAALLAGLDVTLSLVPRRPEMAETEPLEPFTAAFFSLGDLRGYGRQTAGGHLHFGLRSIDSGLDAPEPTGERIHSALAQWVALFPHLDGVRVRRTWTGFTNWTPDAVPVLGPVPGVEGLHVCTGFSGHGFALGPAIGEVMAALVSGRTPPVNVDALSIARFGARP